MSDPATTLLLQLKKSYPHELLASLCEIGKSGADLLYLVGGTVRDLFLGRNSKDLDIAVQGDPEWYVRRLIEMCGGGTLVPLSDGNEPACRAVIRGMQVDFAGFRGGAKNIDEDLQKRDFTVNAMAIDFVELLAHNRLNLIDPAGGRQDLDRGVVRHLHGAFEADPLRLLRGYRFSAGLGFELLPETRREVTRCGEWIVRVAPERVSYELQCIFESDETTKTIKMMADDGLLAVLMPELYAGDGVEQPEFHHLDVLGHSFLALSMMEKIIRNPENYYRDQAAVCADYLSSRRAVRGLKWAALMHDIGKPGTREVQESKNGRVTFYGHDETGRALFREYAENFRWSQADSELVSGLIGMHMHPFHLCNVQRKKTPSVRAILKLCKRAGDHLPGLFLLAMADSLASEGEKKPVHMERELGQLFSTVVKMYAETIETVVKGPKLVTGHDLINEFGLTPGPVFGRILDALEIARVEGVVSDRQGALDWIGGYLEQTGCGR